MIDGRKFTKKDIPNEELRLALNCYYSKTPCSKRLWAKCREMNPRVWKKCPRQTGKYIEGEIRD